MNYLKQTIICNQKGLVSTTAITLRNHMKVLKYT